MSDDISFARIAVILIVYFAPSLIAWRRRHRKLGTIFVVQIIAAAVGLLGYFTPLLLAAPLGWVVTLIWSFTSPQRPVEHDEIEKRPS